MQAAVAGSPAGRRSSGGRRRSHGQATGQLSYDLSAEARQALSRRNCKVALDSIGFDLALQYGQPRRLDSALVRERANDLRACPPVGPVREIVLLAMDPAGRSYVVLGGQHTVAALQEMAKEGRAEKRKLAEWETHVVAMVLHFATPRHICQEWAGWQQNRQGSVAPMALSRWAAAYLSLLPGNVAAISTLLPSSEASSATQGTGGSTKAEGGETQAVTSSSSTSTSGGAAGGSSSSSSMGLATTLGTLEWDNPEEQMKRVVRATVITGHKRYPTDVCGACPENTVLSCLPSSQVEMMATYGHVAEFVEVGGMAAVKAIQHLEAAQAVTAISLRKLKRLYTPQIRKALLGELPNKSMSLKAFEKGIEECEWRQWTSWQWEGAPDDVIHPERRQDANLREMFRRGVQLSDLKVVLGRWTYRAGRSPTPSWDSLRKARVWSETTYMALRQKIASPPHQWETVPAPDDVVTFCPRRGAEWGGVP